MICDDHVGSFSNSPTSSVRTPDNESFEVDMLDQPAAMRNHYDGQSSRMTSQMLQEGTPAMDSTTFFSNACTKLDLNLDTVWTNMGSASTRIECLHSLSIRPVSRPIQCSEPTIATNACQPAVQSYLWPQLPAPAVKSGSWPMEQPKASAEP
jgi:hypothetical protein